MGHFFIKRGNNLHGPYSESQIQSGVDTGKLKASDLISETSDGPWQSIDQFHAPKVDEEAIAGDEPLTGNRKGFDPVIPVGAPLQQRYFDFQGITLEMISVFVEQGGPTVQGGGRRPGPPGAHFAETRPV